MIHLEALMLPFLGALKKFDDSLKKAWYRFAGDVEISTQCQKFGSCTAYYNGWMTSAHPSINDGVVKREVCFGASDAGVRCRYYCRTIRVIKCTGYYLYELVATKWPERDGRYCTVKRS